MMRAQVIGATQPIGFLPWVAAGLASVTSFLNENADNISLVQSIAQQFGVGPSYNAANGGEIRRQLSQYVGRPFFDPYLDLVQRTWPYLWAGNGDIWSQTDMSQPNNFEQEYLQLMAAGMPAGTRVETTGGHLVPVGLQAAVEAVQVAQEAQQESAAAGSGGSSSAGSNVANRPAANNPRRPGSQPPTRSTNDKTLLYVGLGAAALFFLNRR